MTFAVALCIVAEGVAARLALNSTTSSKEDWRSGRGYLVIRRIPEERALELTQRVAA
jgi:hypothetical protein